MPIKRGSDPVEVNNIVILLYGLHGQGKTTMGYTARKPMVINFDEGLHRVQNWMNGDRWEIEEGWEEIANITPAQVEQNDTIVIDTVGRALDKLADKLIRDDYRNAAPNGGLSLAGYGALKYNFTSWVKMLRTLGKDIVLIAHVDEQLTNGEIIERIDMVGSSKNEVYKSADVIGKLTLKNQNQFLVFDPTETSIGKNPGRLPSMDIPDLLHYPNFLHEVIMMFKDAMNQMANERRMEQERIQALREELASIDTLEAYNERTKEMIANETTKPMDKRILMEVADSHHLLWDKEERVFVAPEVEVEQEPEGEAQPPAEEVEAEAEAPVQQEQTPAEEVQEQPLMVV